MIVLAARPSMGKTSLAMNIAENVALGRGDPEQKPRGVGIFSLEMSHDALVLRMICSHAGVSTFRLAKGYVSEKGEHGKLTEAASVLSKAPIYLDDTGGLDALELRARARRMKKKFGIELIVIDYLQLMCSREHARQGKQIETAAISGHLKAMAKELRLPVMVLSQLSRAPEQRETKPRLSDLRDSGAIEQDADVVCMLRRPCRYDENEQDKTLAIVDVAKQRNGPTGEVELNFVEEFTRFHDRAKGVDGVGAVEEYGPEGRQEAEQQ
jgi:replicative DNA helicase